jgi:type IV pilus assembly protein PilC
MKEYLIVGDEIQRMSYQSVAEAREAFPRALAIIPFGPPKKKMSVSDLTGIFSDMSTMLSTGMNLGDTLISTVASSLTPPIANFYYQVYLGILSGKKFSEAMDLPGMPKLVISVLQAGEESGKLSQVLQVLSSYYFTLSNVNSKIGMAMVMPQGTVIATGAVFLYMLKTLFPQLRGFANEAGATKITGPSAFFFMLSDHFLPVAIVTVILLSLFIKFKNEVILKMPIIGKVYARLNYHLDMFLFASVMNLALTAGIRVQQAVTFIAPSLRSPALKKVILAMDEALDKGSSLSESLATSAAPPMLRNVVNVGERTGNLSDTFSRLADRMRDEILVDVAVVENTMPIAMTLILGVVVFALIGSFYYAYFSIIGQAMSGI